MTAHLGRRARERARVPGLGREAVGVAREHRGLADVVEVEEEHHHALEPDAAARVRVGAVLEGLDVVGQRREVDLRRGGRR